MKRKIIQILIPALLVVGLWFTKEKLDKKNMRVKVARVTMDALNESYLFQGVVIPGESFPVYAEVTTVISKVMIKEGSQVKKGQNLFELSDSSRSELLRELEGVKLDIKNRELQLSNLRSGSIKVELEERKLDQEALQEEINSLKRNIDAVSFEAEYLKGQSEMMEELLAKKGISSVQANEARSLSNKKQLELEDLRTNLELTRQRYELSVDNYRRLQRELNINENDIRGQYQKLILQRKNLEERLSKVNRPIKSPMDGIVTELTATEGSTISPGGKLLSISPGGDFKVKVDVPIAQAENIKNGQEARILNKDGEVTREYSGVVSEVANSAKIVNTRGSEERVVEVEIDVSEPAGMRSGFITEVEINSASAEGMLMISSFSVLEEDGENYVYVLSGDTVKKTQVEIGTKTLSKYEVLNLPEGTEVVVNPLKVMDGQRIRVVRQ